MRVRVIAPTINLLTRAAINIPAKRRVAAYARVSTDSEEQLTSYEAQVDYYTKYINKNVEWEFVKVYTDEGISGTNTKKRNGFNEMIKDALDGKIDLIVTKSVSRFARNTVDSLVTVRKLKDRGVEVYFEKENIYTLDSKGELLITIMSSLAQEESRSISENVTWGQRKRFADGKVSLAYSNFLGYEKGEDGNLRIVESEAETVRRIYRLYIHGSSPQGIAKMLTDEGVPTPMGKKIWSQTTVRSILTNEKYKGSALLQKHYTVDFLTKKMKVNKGEVPQYYVEESHEAIISPEEFELVQSEIERRKNIGFGVKNNSILSTKIICGDCGGMYGSKVWHSNNKYRKVVWQCNNKFKGDKKCTTPSLTEEEIKSRFVNAFNCMIINKTEQIENCKIMLKMLSDTSELDKRAKEIAEEMAETARLAKISIEEEGTGDRYKEYLNMYEHLANESEKIECEKSHINFRRTEMKSFIREMEKRKDVITEFDDQLWSIVVENAVAYSDGRLVFRLRNGMEIE